MEEVKKIEDFLKLENRLTLKLRIKPLSPLCIVRKHFGQSGRGVQTLPTAAGGIIFPIIVPHGKPSVLEWLNPLYYGSRHYFHY